MYHEQSLSGIAIAIRLLRAKYSSTQRLITTLTEMVRGSLIIQQLNEKLLAPIAEHWQNTDRCIKRDNNRSTRVAISLVADT